MMQQLFCLFGGVQCRDVCIKSDGALCYEILADSHTTFNKTCIIYARSIVFEKGTDSSQKS